MTETISINIPADVARKYETLHNDLAQAACVKMLTQRIEAKEKYLNEQETRKNLRRALLSGELKPGTLTREQLLALL